MGVQALLDPGSRQHLHGPIQELGLSGPSAPILHTSTARKGRDTGQHWWPITSGIHYEPSCWPSFSRPTLSTVKIAIQPSVDIEWNKEYLFIVICLFCYCVIFVVMSAQSRRCERAFSCYRKPRFSLNISLHKALLCDAVLIPAQSNKTKSSIETSFRKGCRKVLTKIWRLMTETVLKTVATLYELYSAV